MSEHTPKQQFCAGCRNDFYNHGDASRTGQCWSLPTAKEVTRFRLGWWTTPDTPGAYTEVRTLDCHHEPGRFAFHEKLPPFAVNAHRLDEAAHTPAEGHQV